MVAMALKWSPDAYSQGEFLAKKTPSTLSGEL